MHCRLSCCVSFNSNLLLFCLFAKQQIVFCRQSVAFNTVARRNVCACVRVCVRVSNNKYLHAPFTFSIANSFQSSYLRSTNWIDYCSSFFVTIKLFKCGSYLRACMHCLKMFDIVHAY